MSSFLGRSLLVCACLIALALPRVAAAIHNDDTTLETFSQTVNGKQEFFTLARVHLDQPDDPEFLGMHPLGQKIGLRILSRAHRWVFEQYQRAYAKGSADHPARPPEFWRKLEELNASSPNQTDMLVLFKGRKRDGYIDWLHEIVGTLEMSYQSTDHPELPLERALGFRLPDVSGPERPWPVPEGYARMGGDFGPAGETTTGARVEIGKVVSADPSVPAYSLLLTTAAHRQGMMASRVSLGPVNYPSEYWLRCGPEQLEQYLEKGFKLQREAWLDPATIWPLPGPAPGALHEYVLRMTREEFVRFVDEGLKSFSRQGYPWYMQKLADAHYWWSGGGAGRGLDLEAAEVLITEKTADPSVWALAPRFAGKEFTHIPRITDPAKWLSGWKPEYRDRAEEGRAWLARDIRAGHAARLEPAPVHILPELPRLRGPAPAPDAGVPDRDHAARIREMMRKRVGPR